MVRTRVIGLCALLAASGCAHRRAGTGRAVSPPTSHPAVSLIDSREITGSLIPLSANLGLTTLHVYRQSMAWIDGTLTGLDLESCGDASAGIADDWVIVRLKEVTLPAADRRVAGYRFREGETVYVAGFVRAASTSAEGEGVGDPAVRRTPTVVRGVVMPSVAGSGEGEQNATLGLEGVTLLAVDGSPDLSGMSGGPVAVWDGAWSVVGMYVGRWSSGDASGYAVMALPEAVFAPMAEVQGEGVVGGAGGELPVRRREPISNPWWPSPSKSWERPESGPTK